MKKAFCAVALTVLCLLCFAGCTEDNNSTQSVISVQSTQSVASVESKVSSIPSTASSENTSSMHINRYTYDVEIYEIANSGWDYSDVEFPFKVYERNVLDCIKPIKANDDAFEVARSIIKEYHSIGKHLEYELCDIIHYKNNNTWQFTYSITPQYEIDVSLEEWRLYVNGGIFYIAVDSDKGELLQAWVGE